MLNLGFKSRRAGDATFSLSWSHMNCLYQEPSVFASGLPSSSPAGGLCVDPFPSWVATEPSQFSLCFQMDVAWGCVSPAVPSTGLLSSARSLPVCLAPL